MTIEQQKEQFSIAYVRAVAAVAGVNVYKPEIDDDSVDMGFASKLVQNLACKPRLEAQLKCTANPDHDADSLRFPLKIKNYEDLRVDSIVPRILILVVVPEDIGYWLEQRPEEMVLRHAAYWFSLQGQPDSPNTTSVTVAIPKTQSFTKDSLLKLLRLEGVS